MTASTAASGPELLNTASFGAYAVGPEQDIRFWNPAAERILGHKGWEVIGRPCYQVVQASPNESLPPVCQQGCPFTRLAGQGRIPPPFRTQLLCASGQRKQVLLTSMIIPGEDGRITLAHLFDELPDNEGAGVPALAEMTGVAVIPGKPGTSAPGLTETLTVRELLVLRLMADGLTNHEIADNLTLSYHTVRNHVCNVRGKLQAKNREQATIIGRNLGLI